MRHIQTASTLGYAVHSTIIAAWALTAQKLRNLLPSHCECQPCCHIEDASRESIRASLLGGASTVKVERSGPSNTFTAHSEPYNRERFMRAVD
jgi:hypothetical protein